MAHQNKVLRSVNQSGGPLCVDLFLRTDGSFGFDEYRRDPEDGRGWYSVGHHHTRRFDSAETAWQAARVAVSWLTE